MKNYTIIGGVNGVGKSSFTGVLKELSTDLGVIVDVDKITAELGGPRPSKSGISAIMSGHSILDWTAQKRACHGLLTG